MTEAEIKNNPLIRTVQLYMKGAATEEDVHKEREKHNLLVQKNQVKGEPVSKPRGLSRLWRR